MKNNMKNNMLAIFELIRQICRICIKRYKHNIARSFKYSPETTDPSSGHPVRRRAPQLANASARTRRRRHISCASALRMAKTRRRRRWTRLAAQDVELRGVESTRDQLEVHSPRKEKTEVKFVREASQRRLASHTHIYDRDTHGDQPRRLIIQPELTLKPY
jgi:hypothetical protein